MMLSAVPRAPVVVKNPEFSATAVAGGGCGHGLGGAGAGTGDAATAAVLRHDTATPQMHSSGSSAESTNVLRRTPH